LDLLYNIPLPPKVPSKSFAELKKALELRVPVFLTKYNGTDSCMSGENPFIGMKVSQNTN
jgi:hypothetical protein